MDNLLNPDALLLNVCPTIPHAMLEDQLKKLGLKLVSPITFLRIGVNNPEYSHILSFRRQVYVAPPADLEVPSSILITQDNTSYRIFLSQDGMSCFECKQSGQIASQCPNKSNQESDNPSTSKTTSADTEMPFPMSSRLEGTSLKLSHHQQKYNLTITL
ncbi:unnamed protein product [Ceutorhynchus assimilis]|uniref:Uncharacterized protein n=1 Tax=Ceutorhynchus assimilis TaxID=467358 RepID=A0A9N9QIL8_9CUCU|nr:unnamed protein product [Ceutorhynchus assimilis]